MKYTLHKYYVNRIIAICGSNLWYYAIFVSLKIFYKAMIEEMFQEIIHDLLFLDNVFLSAYFSLKSLIATADCYDGKDMDIR